jgi:lipid-A-disaccharide synthase
VEELLYIVAGEESGDRRGAELLRPLKEACPHLRILGAGGPRLAALADGPFLDWSGEAVVGIWEVVRKYGYFKAQLKRMLAEIEATRPRALLLVDYPGFNLRLAAAAKSRLPNLRTIFYISPQVWAWNRGRIPKMAGYLDLMLCIFPFEKPLYEASGLHAEFVGHPMLDSLAPIKTGVKRRGDLIGLFPGSRDREVHRLFPAMLEAARILSRRHAGLRFEASAANPRVEAWMNEHLAAAHLDAGFCPVSTGRFYSLAQEATVGMVCSGTATLEAAYFGLPMVITYKVTPITYVMGKLLIRVPHIGMPNVLANREIVPELLQEAASPAALARVVEALFLDPARREAQQADFREVIAALGAPGAGARAAQLVAGMLIPTLNDNRSFSAPRG